MIKTKSQAKPLINPQLIQLRPDIGDQKKEIRMKTISQIEKARKNLKEKHAKGIITQQCFDDKWIQLAFQRAATLQNDTQNQKLKN